MVDGYGAVKASPEHDGLLSAVTAVRGRLCRLSSLAFLTEEHVNHMRYIVMSLLNGKGVAVGDGTKIYLSDAERDAAVSMLVELADRAWCERGNGKYLPTGIFELILEFDRHALSYLSAASSLGDGFETALTGCPSYIDAVESLCERKSQALFETCEVLPGGETKMEFAERILERIDSTLAAAGRKKLEH